MFENKKRIAELEKKIRDLEYGKAHKQEVDGLNVKVLSLSAENETLSEELTSKKWKVRKQTEADIYFECAKIMRDLTADKKASGIQDHFQELSRQQAGLAQMRMNEYPTFAPWVRR